MNGNRRVLLGCSLVGAGLLVLTTLAFSIFNGTSWTYLVDSYTLTNVLIGIAFVVTGGVIWQSRPENAVGWLLVAAGMCHLVTSASGHLLIFGIDEGWSEMITRSLATLGSAWALGLPGLFLLALLLFPTGHLPSPRWAPAVWYLIIVTVALSASYALSATSPTISGTATPIAQESILMMTAALPDGVNNALNLAGAFIPLIVIASLVFRYATGDDLIRRQLMWLILAVAVMVVLNTQRFVTGDGPILFLLSTVLIPIAIAIAIVRYRLLDIRFVLSRALLYSLAIGGVIAAYAGIVAGLSLLVPADGDRAVAIVAAIAVAIGFNPLRLLLQRQVDRAFFGSRADPARTAVQFSAEFNSENTDITAVLNRARISLNLPYLAVEGAGVDTIDAGAMLASSGDCADNGIVRLSLDYRGEHLGDLAVGLRRGEVELHDQDRVALNLIGMPLTIALHATLLAADLRSSRAAIVEARESERLRLHRELHDGIGPTLSGLAFTADAVQNLIRLDPGQAAQLMETVRADVRRALEDVRRVVYGLRPIELDELGLVGALRERTESAWASNEAGPIVRLDAPGPLPTLTPAIELAAYRIVMAAVTNSIRHSDATICDVTLQSADGRMSVHIHDDGSAPIDWTPGVGLTSIRERAEEVGGNVTIGPTREGWTVHAMLPV